LKKKYKFKASGSNAFIIPIERKNNIWVGRIHSVGKTGQNHLSENDIVIYLDEDIVKFEVPEKSIKIHSILHYKIQGKRVEVEQANNMNEFIGLK